MRHRTFILAVVALAACSKPGGDNAATDAASSAKAAGTSSAPNAGSSARAASAASGSGSSTVPAEAAATASESAPPDPNNPSAEPTADEWNSARIERLRDVTGTCEARTVREWVRIACPVGVDPTCADDGDKKVKWALGLGKGPLKAKTVRDERDATLVYRLVEGVELKAALQCKFPYPVRSAWAAGTPRPDPIAKIMGGSAIGSSCLSEIDCGAAGMCADRTRLTDAMAKGRDTCVAKDYGGG
jgi:hypothetical protein